MGFSICDQGRVAAGRLWRSSGMVPKRAHRGVHIVEESRKRADRLQAEEIQGKDNPWLLLQSRT